MLSYQMHCIVPNALLCTYTIVPNIPLQASNLIRVLLGHPHSPLGPTCTIPKRYYSRIHLFSLLKLIHHIIRLDGMSLQNESALVIVMNVVQNLAH